MATFAQLVTDIQLDLGSRSGNLLESEIQTEINQAVQDFERDRYDFTEGDDTSISTVANTPDYALAAGVFIVDDVTYRRDGHDYWLERIDHEEFIARSSGTGNTPSEPCHFTIYKRRLFLYPTPNAIFPLTLYGVMRLANVPFTDDAQSNAWSVQARMLIKARAKAYLYAHRLHNKAEADLQEAIAQGQKTILAAQRNRLLVRGHTRNLDQF